MSYFVHEQLKPHVQNVSVAAFLDNVNWRAVEQRFIESHERRVPDRFVVAA